MLQYILLLTHVCLVVLDLVFFAALNQEIGCKWAIVCRAGRETFKSVNQSMSDDVSKL